MYRDFSRLNGQGKPYKVEILNLTLGHPVVTRSANQTSQNGIVADWHDS